MRKRSEHWSAEQAVFALLLFIIVTAPLLFGAVHPVVSGGYGAMLFAVAGCWLALRGRGCSPIELAWYAVPLIVILWQVLQVVPLPLWLLEFVSPVRAARVEAVNELAGAGVEMAAISEAGMNALRRPLVLFGLIIYFACLVRLLEGKSERVRLLCLCMVGVGLFEALYGLLQFVRPNLGVLWLEISTRAAHGTIIYKNQYATLVNMIWPLAFSIGILYSVRRRRRRRNRPRRRSIASRADLTPAGSAQAVMFQMAAGCMVLAVLFSLSRGGIVSMLLLTALLALFLPFPRRRKLWFFGLFFGLIFSYGALLGLNTVVDRFSSLGVAQATRSELYIASLPMLWSHWLTGIGAEAYGVLSPLYLKGFPAGLLYDRAHNEYLELMIELGIPVAVLFIGWLVIGVIVLGVRLRSSADHDWRSGVIGAACYCSILGFLVHGLVDFGWRLPANLLFCVTLLAISVNSLESNGIEQAKRESEVEPGEI